MKKFLCILIVGVFLATSAAGISVKKEETNDCGCEIKDDVGNGLDIICDNVLMNDERSPVLKAFPPKSDYALSLIDPDPTPTMAFEDLPSQFSWKSYGGDWTTPARDQENCGSCWAFGALGALEAAINIKRGYPTFDRDLSEQYILSCLGSAGSCSGGWMSEAIAYIKSTSQGSSGNGINGVPLESCMPYQAVDWIPCDDKCENWNVYNSPPEIDDVLWQVKDFGVTTGSEDDPNHWNLMKSWIITHGPIVIDIYASSGWSSYWWSHHSSTDVYENDDYGITNHANVLCRWVDDSSIQGGGYWILKNSWGSGFGYGGFNNVAYGCLSIGTRDVTWVEAMDWPPDQGGDGPPPIIEAVFADYTYDPDYPHLGEEIEFYDNSQGPVVKWEWDFNGDGVIDSTKRRPTWTYYQDGDYLVNLTVTSSWGLTSTRTYIVGAKEVWPPKVVASPAYYSDNELEVYFEGRYSQDVDGGTIVSWLWDFDDGTTCTESHCYHTFSEGDKMYDVTLTITDNDGGVSVAHCDIRIDITVPPETSAHLHYFGANGEEWFDGTQRVYFEATDWTEVIDTYYRIDDDNEWTRYVQEEQWLIPIAGEGYHTVEFYSKDYFHNVETPKSRNINIDQTEPTVNIQLDGTQSQGYYTGPVTVTLSGSDELSGIDKLYYKHGLYDWIEYTGPFEIDEHGGGFRLDYSAVDVAGNSKADYSMIMFEPEPSKPDIDGPTSGQPGIEYTYTFYSNDYFPEDDQVYYYVDWGDGTNTGWIGPFEPGEIVTRSHIWNTEDTYNIRVKAKDSYDAESEEASLSVSVPKNKRYIFPILMRILERFPILYKLLFLTF